MKIAIDGHNLGLREGTGIATYARQLSRLLEGAGHQVYPIYGLSGVGRNRAIAWSRFLQALITQGEEGSKNPARWWRHSVTRFPSFVMGRSLAVPEVLVNGCVDISSIAERLPAYSKIFNLPSLYRSAQAYSAFSSKSTRISLEGDVRPDILHLTCPLPIHMNGVPKVVTAHDVIPLALPYSTRVNLRHYRKMLGASFRNADLVFSVSEYSKRDLINHFDLPEDKIHVTYQSVAIPERYTDLQPDDVADYVANNFGLEFGKYFLFYGAIEPKKNVARILEAFAVAKTRLPIVIVGKNGWLFEDVEQFFERYQSQGSPQRRFLRIPYTSFSSLMYLLRGARGLVFPSLYEGFGLPVLEAMQMGCPVITSNRSSLPEVGGDAVHYVDPTDVTGIANAVDKFSADSDYIADLIVRGCEQVKRFSPAEHLKSIAEGYGRVLGG